jgi:hypothetical protein
MAVGGLTQRRGGGRGADTKEAVKFNHTQHSHLLAAPEFRL